MNVCNQLITGGASCLDRLRIAVVESAAISSYMTQAGRLVDSVARVSFDGIAGAYASASEWVGNEVMALPDARSVVSRLLVDHWFFVVVGVFFLLYLAAGKGAHVASSSQHSERSPSAGGFNVGALLGDYSKLRKDQDRVSNNLGLPYLSMLWSWCRS